MIAPHRVALALAALGLALLGTGCEGYEPRLCQPCIDTMSCGSGLLCQEGFCVSAADRCEELRGITPYFPDRDGVCDLVQRNDPLDTSKIVVYSWSGNGGLKLAVGLPGAAPPGAVRVAMHFDGLPEASADAWVRPDGSFKVQLQDYHGPLSGDRWYPVDDDGDQCGPLQRRDGSHLERESEHTVPPFRCEPTGPSQTRRCVYQDQLGEIPTGIPTESWCSTRSSHPACVAPTGELCAVTTDCFENVTRFPFPFEQVTARVFARNEVVVAPTGLEFGSLLVARGNARDPLSTAVAGFDEELALDLWDVVEWRVWVERPFDVVLPSSEIWAVNATVAHALSMSR